MSEGVGGGAESVLSQWVADGLLVSGGHEQGMGGGGGGQEAVVEDWDLASTKRVWLRPPEGELRPKTASSALWRAIIMALNRAPMGQTGTPCAIAYRDMGERAG